MKVRLSIRGACIARIYEHFVEILLFVIVTPAVLTGLSSLARLPL